MMQVLLATGNPGKIAEMQSLLGSSVAVVSLNDLGIDSPEETGSTFAENAILKAQHGMRASGLVTIADDSGIEVDALGGAPGVRSARWSGTGDDEQNRLKLMRELDGVPPSARSARFVCVIAIASPGRDVSTFHGTLDGVVADGPRGSQGFGYDALLELPDGRTVAELPASEKNAISHRGIALKNALPYIRSLTESSRPESTEG